MCDAYLIRMGPERIERLRRHHLEDFRNEQELETYVDRKSLKFLSFNAAWVLQRETLDQDTVESYVRNRVNELLGHDKPERLQALSSILETNRKAARTFAGEAMPVLRAWCRKHDARMPAVWESGELHAVARQVENRGLLDLSWLRRSKCRAFAVEQHAGPTVWPRRSTWRTSTSNRTTCKRKKPAPRENAHKPRS